MLRLPTGPLPIWCWLFPIHSTSSPDTTLRSGLGAQHQASIYLRIRQRHCAAIGLVTYMLQESECCAIFIWLDTFPTTDLLTYIEQTEDLKMHQEKTKTNSRSINQNLPSKNVMKLFLVRHNWPCTDMDHHNIWHAHSRPREHLKRSSTVDTGTV